MLFKRCTAIAICVLAVVVPSAWPSPEFKGAPKQQYAQMSRTSLTAVQLPVQQPFSVLSRIPGPKGSLYVQVEWQVQSGFRSVVWEIHMDGKVAATYDLATAGSNVGTPIKFAVDSSGSVYYLTLPNPKVGESSGKASPNLLLPVVYVFREGGTLDKVVTLSRQLEARQLVVTSSGTIVVAGSLVGTGVEGTARARQVLYEFKSNGDFIREIKLVSKEKRDEGTALAASDPEKFALVADLSHLLVDPANNFYLIEPSAEPRVLRFGSDGELTIERRLPKLSGTMVTQAILDEQGRIVLERGTIRKPREPKPENRTHILTVLNAETLDTILEAAHPPDAGGLAAVNGSDFVFLSRHGPITLDIATGSMQ